MADRTHALVYFSLGAASITACTLLYTTFFQAQPTPLPPPSPTTSSHNQPLPYPPSHFIPNPRDLPTPYGTIRLYEWGPSPQTDTPTPSSPRPRNVLLLHGISGSCVVLLPLASSLARAGCHVMLIDLFGRGWSGGPTDLPYDGRLYASLVFMCLASSEVCWTGGGATFTLVGYSLGGGIAADFASWFPGLIQDLVLIAPGGLLKGDWRSRLIYSGFLPEGIMRWVLRRRLGLAGPRPAPPVEDEEKASLSSLTVKNPPLQPDLSAPEAAGQATGTQSLAERAAGLDLDAIVAWQLDHNAAFVRAFASSIRFAPTREQQMRWRVVGENIAKRKAGGGEDGSFTSGNVLVVLGGRDSIVRVGEFVPEAEGVLGREGVEVLVFGEAGHGVATEMGGEIAEALVRRWGMG